MNPEKTIQYAEQDAERMIHTGAVRRTLPKARVWMAMYLLTLVGLVGGLAVFTLISIKKNPLFWVMTLCWFVFFMIPLRFILDPFRSAMDAYRKAYRRSYPPLVLGQIFTGLDFLTGSGISWGTVADTNMMYPGQFLESQSVIRGQYQSIPFEQSEIQTEISVRRHYKSGVRYDDKTIFRGQWTTVSLDGRYAPELQIIQRGFRNTKHRLSFLARYKIGRRVFLKDLRFDLLFRVYTGDRDDADAVLTPEVRKQILNLTLRTRGKLMLCFVDGALHIALQTRRKAFSPPCVFLPFRDEKSVASIRREINPYFQLIDKLCLDNQALFSPADAALDSFGANEIT